MNRNVKSLTGFTIGALDGEIGKVNEFYFDDESWTITKKPVSRQEEIKLSQHYPWRSYWEGALWAGSLGTAGMVIANPVPIVEESKAETAPVDSSFEGNQHLRSTYKITGYHIEAVDGEIGRVEDYILDDESWKIDFIVVDTGNWLPGKKVLIAPELIKEISWLKSVVEVKASVETIQLSPDYDFGQPLTAVYTTKLLDYYKDANL